MKNFFSKISISGVALAVFLAIMALLTLYFFVTMADNQEALEKRGYHALEKLGSGMKQKDNVYSWVAQSFRYIKFSHAGPSVNSSIAKNFRPGSSKEPDALNYVYDTASTKTQPLGFDTAHVFLKDFITPLIRRDFFSDYLFISNNKITFSTFAGDMKLSDSNLSLQKIHSGQVMEELVPLSSMQKSNDTLSAIQSGKIYTINIKGTNYLLFLIPLKFHQNPNCILGGFIQEKKFIQDKRSLPSNLIVIFIFMLLLIIISFPILKVYIMSPREKLTRPGVSFIGISIVSGTMLVVIMLSHQLINCKMNSDHSNQLKILNDTVRNAFQSEKDTILKQLDWYNRQNMFFSPRVTTYQNILDTIIPKDSFLQKPFYPFYKNVFWADAAGKQRVIITPYKKAISTKVDSREYFIHPEKYQFRTDWYNMEPIYSQTSGEWSIAFSMPAKYDSARIVALIAPMYSLKSPVLPQGFEYCLIDKDGKVWYHSEEIFDVGDNLKLESEDNKSLISALNSGESDDMELEIRNRKYLAYVAPVPHSDLFVVSLYNQARAKSIGALTAMFVLAFFILVFFILFLFYAVINLVKRNKSKLEGKEYFFKWLLPGKQNNRTYWQLIKINGLILLLLLGFKSFESGLNVSLSCLMLSLLVLIIAHCVVTYRVLTTAKGSFKDDPLSRLSVKIPNYTFYVISWLLVIIIVPVIILSSAFISAETAKYRQRQQQFLAYRMNERTELFHQYFKENISHKQRESSFHIRNTKGLYFMCLDSTQLTVADSLTSKAPPLVHSPLLILARSTFDRAMNETEPVAIDPLIESKCLKIKNADVSIVFEKEDYNDQGVRTSQSSVLTTHNSWSGIFDLFHENHWYFPAFLFWGLVVVMTVLIGFLINWLVKMLFFSCDSECIPPVLLAELEKNVKSQLNVIIISYDQPDIPLLKQNGWTYADLEESTPGEIGKAEGNLVLVNFETGIDTLENFKERNQLLDQLLDDHLVALWLDKSPEQVIAAYKEGWKQQKGFGASASEISLFMKLVSGMLCIYPETRKYEMEGVALCKNLSDILDAEINFNPGIQKYNLLIKEDIKHFCAKNNSKNRGIQNVESTCHAVAEDLILRIQELSSTFYDYVWSSLSEDEQFLLLDLAQDTLLNLKNKKTIALLFKKGILHRKERIEFVSPSFKNYILTDIDKSTFEQMQKKIEEEGTWHRFKVPLILIATSLVVFLVITQQNFLSGMSTILVSATALIGVYLRFSGLFSKTKET
ncbi:MAG: cache domain-containing protein [Bacteroidota bacterium]